MKKMEIGIVTTHMTHSPIIVDSKVVLVKDLPEGLRARTTDLLKTLECFGVTAVFLEIAEGGKGALLVKKDGKKHTPDIISHKDTQNALEEMTVLLARHFGGFFESKEIAPMVKVEFLEFSNSMEMTSSQSLH